MDESISNGGQGGESRRGECAGGDGATSRRRALGQMSAAALAAMVGVELWPGRAAAVPVTEGTGSQSGPAERAYPTPAADGVTIDREAQVILVRFQQRAYAFNLACPHENTALRWKERDGHFQCPRHESQYRPDGTFISGRATRNMDRFPIKRDGDRLVVDLDRLLRSDQQPQDWGAAAVSL
jgi:nitrite reductase/ring-hydroxylating ferredoxin subunit